MGGTIATSSTVRTLPATGPISAAGSDPALGATVPTLSPAVAAALEQLRVATEQLAAAVQAMGGAGNVVEGGGPTGGCGCSPQTAPPPGDPTQRPTPDQSGPRAPAPRPPAESPAPPSPAPPPPPPAGGGVRQRIVDIARQELAKGVTEDAGSDTDSAGNIVKYRGAVTGPGEDPNLAEPWCADFASWVLREAGAPIGANGRGEDYTVALIDWAKSVNRWQQNTGQPPRPGDLVLIDWDGGEDVDHVAVVERVENGRVHTIGGNENEGVTAASYPIGDSRMMGFVPPG